MAVEVLMPKMGLTMTEGKIVRWLKQEGEWVEKGEPLLEILTEKVSTEVESPGQGLLAKVLYSPGDVIPVTKVIAVLAAEGEDISDYLKDLADKPEKEETEPGVSVSAMPSNVSDTGKGKIKPVERIKASPLARRIAAEEGLTSKDLGNIEGTGPDGRIVKKDVLAYSAARKEQPVALTAKKIPLNDLRQVIARRMTESWTSTPHFYLEAEVDVSELLALRARMNEFLERNDNKISMNDVILKVVAAVLSKHSYINASFTEEGIELKEEINVGIAVGSDEGLIVPVLKHADQKGLSQITRESKELIKKARAGKLVMDDITGGTFTISNLGMFSVDSFTAIINPPECAILSVGKISDKLMLEEGEVVSKPHLRITVGFDHRVVDGLTGAKFLADLKNTLESPFMMIL